MDPTIFLDNNRILYSKIQAAKATGLKFYKVIVGTPSNSRDRSCVESKAWYLCLPGVAAEPKAKTNKRSYKKPTSRNTREHEREREHARDRARESEQVSKPAVVSTLNTCNTPPEESKSMSDIDSGIVLELNGDAESGNDDNEDNANTNTSPQSTSVEEKLDYNPDSDDVEAVAAVEAVHPKQKPLRLASVDPDDMYTAIHRGDTPVSTDLIDNYDFVFEDEEYMNHETVTVPLIAPRKRKQSQSKVQSSLQSKSKSKPAPQKRRPYKKRDKSQQQQNESSYNDDDEIITYMDDNGEDISQTISQNVYVPPPPPPLYANYGGNSEDDINIGDDDSDDDSDNGIDEFEKMKRITKHGENYETIHANQYGETIIQLDLEKNVITKKCLTSTAHEKEISTRNILNLPCETVMNKVCIFTYPFIPGVDASKLVRRADNIIFIVLQLSLKCLSDFFEKSGGMSHNKAVASNFIISNSVASTSTQTPSVSASLINYSKASNEYNKQTHPLKDLLTCVASILEVFVKFEDGKIHIMDNSRVHNMQESTREALDVIKGSVSVIEKYSNITNPLEVKTLFNVVVTCINDCLNRVLGHLDKNRVIGEILP